MTRSALLLAPLVLFGCAKGGGASGSGSATAGKGGRLKVVFIPKSASNPYFDDVERGFKEAAEKFEIDCTTVAPADPEASSQIPIVKDQIQQGVDVIAIAPNAPDTLNAVLDQARSRGIVVITVDADVDDPSHRDAAVLPADFTQVGKGQLELLGKLMDYEGEFAILSATVDAPNQKVWVADMNEGLKDPKYAKMRLVATVFGDDKDQKSATECEALLAKYPNLKGIVSPTSVGLAASAQVLDRAKRGVKLTGLSTPNQLKKFVENGTVPAFQLWSPKDEGFLAAYVGMAIKKGDLKPAASGEIDVPNLGKRKFSDKLELVGGPVVTFDKANVGKYDF